MTVRTKSLKFRKGKMPQERIERLRNKLNDECKLEFIVWSYGTTLDVAGIHDGEPIFRPAICAWEAWKAAWQLLKLARSDINHTAPALPK